MNLKANLRSCFERKPRVTITRTRNCFQPLLELLEDRLAPATFTVNSALDIDDGMPLNATTTLRKAIRLANVDVVADTINFDAAIANQTITLQSGYFAITKPLTISGLGSTKLTIDANNASGIFKVDDGNSATKIAVSVSGLRLTRGSADYGGAIFNKEALALAASTLDHNAATNYGGGIYNDGTLALTNSTLSANSATLGAGIFNPGVLTLTNSTLSANPASDYGGGIYNQGSLTLTNSTLTANSAVNNGGGIVNANNGSVTLTNSTLTANIATNGDGGGIYQSNGTLTVTNSTLSGNGAKTNGGAIAISSGTATITNSTLSANSAGFGGGLYNATGTLVLANSLRPSRF